MGYLADSDKIHVNAVCPSYSETALLDAAKKIHGITFQQLVSVEQVVEAFMMAIEDDSLKGDCIRITPEYGIDVVGRRGKSISNL